MRTAGESYEQTKADGASDSKASLYAMGNGLFNAAIEVGGGLETLPKELQSGPSAFGKWIWSSAQEGAEEPIQGVIERGLQNVVYGKKSPLFSAGDETAVFNPATAAKEFGVGTAVGGILGGGQMLAADVANTTRGINYGEVAQQFWTKISDYVDHAISKSRFVENPMITNETVEDLKIGVVSDDLANKLNREYGLKLNGYEHVLTDNDIRHIYNRHGPHTKEKFPITAEDIKNIPQIIEDADDVYYLPRNDGKAGLMYRYENGNTTFYLEQIVDSEKKLRNKQMIKVPSGEIPDIKGLKDAIYQKSINPLPSDAAKAVPQMYVHDVRDDAVNKIPYLPKAVKPFASTPHDYAALLRKLAKEREDSETLTPEQETRLDTWNLLFPEMRMTADEFLAR